MKIKDHFLTQEIFEIKETEAKGVYKTFPIPTNLDKYYDSVDYISHHQDSGSLKEKLYKFLQGFNLKYKKDILKNELPSNAKVLDYGCGAGEFLKFIENDFKTLGLEPNNSARNFASEKLSKTKILSDLNSIENGSLDAITLWHVFEHIDNQEDILKIFHNKLKINGLLIIAIPNPTSFDAQHYKEFWAAYDVPRHIYHFTKLGMEKLMNNENWKIKKIKPLLLDSFYISMLSEKYKKSSLFWIKGMIFGSISNFKALKTGEYSSLIYVIEKK
ncbi:class I SAM-dependent methyltransferase [Kaistella jeonii]|uniref:Methyltransferase type 11 n=1 Tax=Kaistella jeonii TaxID=266749 RepID=A0A0C1FEC0_9FLAO|nr:class I SAM-dependent methyltransferase [Kaistella jeonii]KIA90138.1 methyltransferase type 11 [Kaistella jeonii]SFB77192.1 Methyltransferase domain-containing protein [Kaistella jeonii]VEI96421.1 bifunctional 3-demethylubiquinone-9 3-methyltransferase/ 2-octaprenyl-6-hydroxy phenol methylase [Kaistella jeonii]